ncbi:methyl-accepting chemotaxis protein [Paraburkholderia tropica]|uniref:methyl-accepting chemotaxis protein n=1 Tax=Paraburkholderia tropica TaxID=92647 RepID=UPI001592515F|nr:methyl-accepting chemotaxis protein [Paraburkholderia tropica]
MKNITVRFSLVVVLIFFSMMILLGGALGIKTLHDANRSEQALRELARQTILVNDAYKDTTRTRSALTRAYSALKEQSGISTRDEALASASRSADASRKLTEVFKNSQVSNALDAELKQQIIASAGKLASALQRASDALAKGDTLTYASVNNHDVTDAGAEYSANVEKFQQLADQVSESELSRANATYNVVIYLVVAGVILALALTVVAHFALDRIVSRPLDRAAVVLDQIAAGDLTVNIPPSSKTEIGMLFAAMRRMRDGLAHTVSGVRDSCEAIHAAARDIAAGNLDLSSRTEEQSASLEQTAASMEQLTSTVRQNAEHATQAGELANSAADLARQGGAVVNDAVSTMTDISASSSKIADIIGIIDSIAFQTNILALNAAVESARAGEHGRGFAVVAGEVRALAQRSASAAAEIKALITASIDHVTGGNGLVIKAGQMMSEIVSAVSNVATIMDEIRTATAEQTDGIEQVGHAVTQMDQVTQQNAALVEEAAAASSALEEQAGVMRKAVAAFRVNEATYA